MAHPSSIIIRYERERERRGWEGGSLEAGRQGKVAPKERVLEGRMLWCSPYGCCSLFGVCSAGVVCVCVSGVTVGVRDGDGTGARASEATAVRVVRQKPLPVPLWPSVRHLQRTNPPTNEQTTVSPLPLSRPSAPLAPKGGAERRFRLPAPRCPSGEAARSGAEPGGPAWCALHPPRRVSGPGYLRLSW
jgi:hypothetical protein